MTRCNRERQAQLKHDIGIAVPAHALQLGLNFAATLPELFSGKAWRLDIFPEIQPFQGWWLRALSPRVARASQPWAE